MKTHPQKSAGVDALQTTLTEGSDIIRQGSQNIKVSTAVLNSFLEELRVSGVNLTRRSRGCCEGRVHPKEGFAVSLTRTARLSGL